MSTPDTSKASLQARAMDFLRVHWQTIMQTTRSILQAIWWTLSLLALLVVLALRTISVTGDHPTTFDIGLMGLVAILILLPFVSELTAFGITVKKHIEEAKKELKQNIKEEAQSVRSEIVALGITNRLTSNVTFQTGIPNPPPDSALDEIREQISEILRQFQDQRGMRDMPRQQADISENTVFAFQYRYLVEREVKRIWNSRIRDGDVSRLPFFSKMVDDLVRYELISRGLGRSLKDVFSVASSAIHGEEPSQEKVSFLREVAPEIVAALSSIR